MTPKRIALLVLVLLVLGVGALFWTVNAPTRVDLLFRLPLIGAWHLVDGISLPLLLLITLVVGAVPAAILAGMPAMTAGRVKRNLDRQVVALKEELEDLKRSGRGAVAKPPAKPTPAKSPAPAPAPASKPPAPTSSPAPAKPASSAALDDFDDLI